MLGYRLPRCSSSAIIVNKIKMVSCLLKFYISSKFPIATDWSMLLFVIYVVKFCIHEQIQEKYKNERNLENDNGRDFGQVKKIPYTCVYTSSMVHESEESLLVAFMNVLFII